MLTGSGLIFRCLLLSAFCVFVFCVLVAVFACCWCSWCLLWSVSSNSISYIVASNYEVYSFFASTFASKGSLPAFVKHFQLCPLDQEHFRLFFLYKFPHESPFYCTGHPLTFHDKIFNLLCDLQIRLESRRINRKSKNSLLLPSVTLVGPLNMQLVIGLE